ncbi:hypothetical protein ANO11243_013910 [Dothideomycetidae sp. 11243]|nr:hypothetical protein ANO11243_013910 [fungal sp. No.11243]
MEMEMDHAAERGAPEARQCYRSARRKALINGADSIVGEKQDGVAVAKDSSKPLENQVQWRQWTCNRFRSVLPIAQWADHSHPTNLRPFSDSTGCLSSLRTMSTAATTMSHLCTGRKQRGAHYVRPSKSVPIMEDETRLLEAAKDDACRAVSGRRRRGREGDAGDVPPAEPRSEFLRVASVSASASAPPPFSPSSTSTSTSSFNSRPI